MSSVSTIAISPAGRFPNESVMINQLFEAGLERYHIYKTSATEQSIAEILEGVIPKYLGRITLHSHFHLVLAYGVGGIHYALAHRVGLGADYIAKVNLYQSFGVKVSTESGDSDSSSPANYILADDTTADKVDSIYYKTKALSKTSLSSALLLDDILNNYSIEEILDHFDGQYTE